MTREVLYPPPEGSTLVDARQAGLTPGEEGWAEDRTTPRLPTTPGRRAASRIAGSVLALTAPENAELRARGIWAYVDRDLPKPPLRGHLPPPWRLPAWHSSLLSQKVTPQGVPAGRERLAHAATLTTPGNEPSFTPPRHMGRWGTSLHLEPRPPIGVPERFHLVAVDERGPWIPRQLTPLPGCVLGGRAPVPGDHPQDLAERRQGGLAGALPKAPPTPGLFTARRPKKATPRWDLPGTTLAAPDAPDQQIVVQVVDVYFSAGRRKYWGTLGTDDTQGYMSCDDGNDRNADLWRVRLEIGSDVRIGEAERVLRAPEMASYTQPAVRPGEGDDDGFVAFKSYVYTNHNTLDPKGTQAVYVARRDHATGALSHPVLVAAPSDFMGGGIGWPGWLGPDTLLTSTDWEGYKSVHANRLSEWGGDLYALPGGTEAIAGPEVRVEDKLEEGKWAEYGHFQQLPAEKLARFARMRQAADPDGHENVLYEGEDRGRRIVAFGKDRVDEGDTSERFGIPWVFDPDVHDPYGVFRETPALPPQVHGCHHPTWNRAGDMFQGSHQQSKYTNPDGSWHRSLHGFTWRDGRWRPWDGNRGHLFPKEPEGYAHAAAWYQDLPNSLKVKEERGGEWPDLKKLLRFNEPASPATVEGYTWKYGSFCGKDSDYVVAQFAASNGDWARDEFTGYTTDQADAVALLGQMVSRVVLIHLRTGKHWDLTSKVAEAVGATERPGYHQRHVFGIYPTCSEPVMRVASWAGGMSLLANAPDGGGIHVRSDL